MCWLASVYVFYAVDVCLVADVRTLNADRKTLDADTRILNADGYFLVADRNCQKSDG